MALSDELEALAKRHGALSYRNRADTQNPAFGFSVAGLESLLAEVSAQDTALIRQMLEALECCMDDVSDKLAQLEGASFNDTPELYAQERIVEIANNAITAARARLAETEN